MLNNKIKGYCSLVSAVFTHLIIGNAFTFGNFVYYYKSYLHYKEIDNISILDLLFVAPVSAACLNILPIVTGYLDNTFGIRILTIIASLCLLTSQLIIYFFTKYYLMIIAYIFFGFAGSITYLPTLRNCWKYFPKKKGIISGILLSSCGLSVFLFTSIGDFIINPNAEGKIDSQFYSKEVAMRYTKYLKFYISCVIILGTLSSILSFPYKEEKIIEDKIEKININENKENLVNENVDIIDEKDNRYSVKSNKNEENAKDTSLEADEKLTLKECLFSVQFLLCFTMVGCTLLFGFLLTNTYRPFGVSMHLNELGIQTLSKAYTLLNTFSRILWGLLYDKFGFKYPYSFVCINQIVCSSLIYLSAKNIYTYFICCCFGVLSFSGHMILFPNLVTKKFGIDNSVTLLGVCGLLGGTTCLLGPVLTSSIIKDNRDYLKTYLIAGSTTIVSLILTFIIKIEKMKKSSLLVQENNTENNPEKIEENNKDNREENVLESTEGNTIENNKDSKIENSHDNDLENNKDSTIESNIDNKNENNLDNIESNNAKENINENITDNNPENTIKNKEKIIDDNIEGKEENVTETLTDDKEEKLIEN